MKKGRFILLYLTLLVAQIIICNYFSLSNYVLISVLPILILVLPHRMNTILVMLIAFVSGLAVDFFSTGMLGITSLALVPVALNRRILMALVFGDELVSREEETTVDRVGILKASLMALISCAIYFLVYIWADSAGTVGFWPAAGRFLLSVVVSTPVCVLVARLLRPE